MARLPGRLGLRRVSPNDELSVVEHLTELRHRLFVSVLTLVVAFAALYAFSDQLLNILLDPLPVQYRKLLALSPQEPFMVMLKVVLGASVLVALPVLLYQLYAFIIPAVATHTRRVMLAIVGGISALFIGGVVFGYFLVLPVALRWLLGFAGNDFTVALRAADYFTFALTMLFAAGLVFEVPIAMLLLARLGLVSATQFREKWRIAIVAIAFLAAILPGGDPVSMLLLMAPQIVLYIVGIWLASSFGRPAAWAREGLKAETPPPTA